MPNPDLRALTALRRLKRVETDAARRNLGEAMAQETALAERTMAVEREFDRARQVTGEFDREAFSAWFQRIRSERVRLADAMRDAEARTASLRAALAHRRVAETAAEDALARKVAEWDATTAWRDQLTLEDAARALTRSGDGE